MVSFANDRNEFRSTVRENDYRKYNVDCVLRRRIGLVDTKINDMKTFLVWSCAHRKWLKHTFISKLQTRHQNIKAK